MCYNSHSKVSLNDPCLFLVLVKTFSCLHAVLALFNQLVKSLRWTEQRIIRLFLVPTCIHGKYLVGENLGELYRQKLLVRKNLINKLQLVHIPYTFSVYLWIMVRKIMANGSRFANFSPNKIFQCMVSSHHI